MSKKRVDRNILSTVLSVEKIDLLYSRDERLPFLYKWRLFFITPSVLISFCATLILMDIQFNSFIRVLMGLSCFLTISVLLLAPYFYFASKPIIKRMEGQGFNVSGVLFFPLSSVELYQAKLSEIYEHCICKGFLSGSWHDIERIDMYIQTMKELLNGRKYRERFRIFGVPQMAAIFFLLLGAFLGSFLPSQLYTEMSMEDLKNKLFPSFVLFALSLFLLMIWELFLRAYDFCLNRDHNQVLEACDLLNNIKLNLIYNTGSSACEERKSSSIDACESGEARDGKDSEEVKVEFVSCPSNETSDFEN